MSACGLGTPDITFPGQRKRLLLPCANNISIYLLSPEKCSSEGLFHPSLNGTDFSTDICLHEHRFLSRSQLASEVTRTQRLPSPLEGLGQRGLLSETTGPLQAMDQQGSGRGRGASRMWGGDTL